MLFRRFGVRRVGWWALGGLVAYAVIGFLILPPIVKSVSTKRLSEALHRAVTIRSLHINPFSLSARIEGFSIKDREGEATFVGFEELFVDAQIISLIKGGPVLREVRLKAPRISLVRNQDERYNFSDLLESMDGGKPAAAPPSKTESKPFLFSINNIQLEDGRLEFEDRPKSAHHTVRDLRVAIPFLSNLPYDLETFVQPAFEATINDTPIRLTGKTKPFKDTMETTLDINISEIAIPKYLDYVPVDLPVRIPSATLSLQTELSFVRGNGNPQSLVLRGQVGLKDLVVTDKARRPMLALPALSVGIHSADVSTRRVHLSSVLLQSPELHARRDRTGMLNLTAISPPAAQSPGPPGAKEQKGKTDHRPLSLEVDEVRLADARVHFIDEATTPAFRTAIHPLDLSVLHFSTDQGKTAAVNVVLKTDGGERITHDGSLTLQPFSVEGRIEVQGVRINRYAPYYRSRLLFEVADGMIGLSTRYKYRKEGGQDQAALSELAVGLKSLRLRTQDEKLDVVAIPAFSLKQGEVDVAARKIAIAEIYTQKGRILLKRARDGKLNVAELVAGGGQPAAPAEQPQATKGAAPVRPWVISLKRLAVERYAVRLEDHTPADPVSLGADPLTLTLDDFSTAKNSKARVVLNVTLNKRGIIGLTGALGANPLSAKIKASVKELELVPFQPYVGDRLNVLLTGGSFSTKGDVEFAMTADQQSAISFGGEAAVTGFSLLDKNNDEALLKWESLAVTGMQVGTAPMKVDMQLVALTDFYSRLIVNPDGTLNVQGLAKEKPAAGSAEGAATESAPPTPIAIEAVSLQGGTVIFTDRYVKPNFTAEMTGLTGKVSGLSSEESRRAEVEFHGQLRNQSPLEIMGTINPLSRDLFANIKLDFKHIELSAMTPYAARYAGYSIEKGKLSLSLNYHIENRKLTADHHLYVDQFNFGDKVESPEATNLPVRLAVSLLKDRNGVIDLKFPVSGSLDDPQFSVWGVILQVIRNLLVKAATSPFALVQALAGDNVELSHLEFDPGKAKLGAAADQKLKALAKVLIDRPALSIEVTGHVDVEKDRAALRQERFERKLKAQKLKDLLKRGETGLSIEMIKINPDEYADYLSKAYKEETFPKPKNFLGFAKSLPVPEMEQLMLADLRITDDDLRQLSDQRAQVVQAYLVTAGQVAPQRVFVVQAKTLPMEPKEKVSASRVDFSLR